MSNWYDAPKKVKPKKEIKPMPEWTKPFWPSVLASVGAGAIFGLLTFILQYFFPSPVSEPLDFGGEIASGLLLIFMSASFGLVFGLPPAFLFGKLILDKTQDLKKPLRNIIIILAGGIFAIIAKIFINFLLNQDVYANILNYEYILAVICGMIGAKIFEKSINKEF